MVCGDHFPTEIFAIQLASTPTVHTVWKSSPSSCPILLTVEIHIIMWTGSKKVYGCLPPSHEESFSHPKEAEGFLFAPLDVTPWEAVGKDDMHGIGYRGIQDQHILGSRKATKALYGMSGEVGVVWVWFNTSWVGRGQNPYQICQVST